MAAKKDKDWVRSLLRDAENRRRALAGRTPVMPLLDPDEAARRRAAPPPKRARGASTDRDDRDAKRHAEEAVQALAEMELGQRRARRARRR